MSHRVSYQVEGGETCALPVVAVLLLWVRGNSLQFRHLHLVRDPYSIYGHSLCTSLLCLWYGVLFIDVGGAVSDYYSYVGGVRSVPVLHCELFISHDSQAVCSVRSASHVVPDQVLDSSQHTGRAQVLVEEEQMSGLVGVIHKPYPRVIRTNAEAADDVLDEVYHQLPVVAARGVVVANTARTVHHEDYIGSASLVWSESLRLIRGIVIFGVCRRTASQH